MGAADNTETNAILASGLAIVGLLGVVGSMLPSDMLPSRNGAGSETASELAIAQPAESGSAEMAEKSNGKQAESTGEPVFKPVELQSITDADPKAPNASVLEESASAATSGMVKVPAELVKAADEVLNSVHESVPAVPSETSNTEQVEESSPGGTKVLTEAPQKDAEVEADVKAPVATQLPPVYPSADAAPSAAAPPWGQWQGRGYQHQQPQFVPPQYPPQVYPYPQWSYPQR